MGAKVCRRWTQYEKEYVEDKWGIVSTYKIAKHLNRSYEAIKRYAEKNNLGGSCYNEYFYTTVQVGEMLGVDQSSVLSYIKKGTLKAKIRRIPSGKIYLIDPDDFEIFKQTYKRRNYNVWTVLQEKQLLELVKEGKTNKEIAEVLGKTERSIRAKRVRLLRKEREQ